MGLQVPQAERARLAGRLEALGYPYEEETDNPEGWRYTYIDSILSDDKGYVYTYDHQTVNVYGPDGSFVFSKSGDELNGQICQLSASEVGMTTSSADGKMVFKQLDPETKDWGKETPVSSRAWNILPGNDVYAYFFMDNGNIFGERRDTGEVEKVVDWVACDVDSNNINSDQFGFLSDGRIVAVTYDYSDDGPSRQQILVLNRVDAASVTAKTELTLACLYLDYNLRSQIVKFNKSNPDYRIVVKDYADEFMDIDSGAPGVDEELTSAASDRGAGPLGFAGTARASRVARACATPARAASISCARAGRRATESCASASATRACAISSAVRA